MGKFIKGDVVVVPFPFSDLSASKRRPALVLVDLEGDDLILGQITSKTVFDEKAILIENSDFHDGGLNQVSNVRPNKLFTADEGIVLYKAGKLTDCKLNSIIDSVIEMFRASDNIKEGSDDDIKESGEPSEDITGSR